MRINKSFILRQVAGIWVVLPLGAASVDFNGMLTLNESGAFLWKQLEEGANREDLIAAVLREYEVSHDVALADVDEFLDKLRSTGCLEN